MVTLISKNILNLLFFLDNPQKNGGHKVHNQYPETTEVGSGRLRQEAKSWQCQAQDWAICCRLYGLCEESLRTDPHNRGRWGQCNPLIQSRFSRDQQRFSLNPITVLGLRPNDSRWQGHLERPGTWWCRGCAIWNNIAKLGLSLVFFLLLAYPL